MTHGSWLSKRLDPWVVLLMAAVWLAATAWMRPLAVPDEGRYAGVALEMLRSGNWLVPTLDGLPYFHKPPLFYWITAASLWLFGPHEWAARAAPLAGAAVASFALYAFALRWSGQPSARASLLVLVTQPLFFIGAQFANLDMLVAGCIAATVLALAHVALQAEQGQTSRGVLALAYVFAALGLLAKGLIGVALPGLVILAWLLVLRRLRLITALLWLPGIPLFLAIAVPWFVSMQERFPEFADYFFIVQHFKRFAQAGFNNAQPFWFMPAALALTTLPWILWLPAAARPAYWNDSRLGPVRKLMWLWLVLVTIFFSIPQSKIIGYVLPTAVPLAFLIGDRISLGWPESTRLSRLWRVGAVLAVAACMAVVAAGIAFPGKSLRDLGRTLAERAAPGEPVVFLYDYYFDVPFYAQLSAPVRVVADWGDPQVVGRDNWSKELLDAQRFASGPAARVLLSPAELVDTICNATTTWVVGYYTKASLEPALANATEIARSGTTALWRVPGRPAAPVSAGSCPGTPSANSANKS
ncbi:MAG TPA: glycosyltransferase family 39 protein [Ramlibacter sp.]|nr:glycosyltransferase family 39 protein [Ramlibacter sp.]